MKRIHVLPQGIADRIAAGEVVERPASVVKELVENALDAGATQVVIEIEGAGLTLIRVADNGSGIHPDDLRLAVQRFATSKIAGAEDLFAIRSLGFRGEALRSIAAVSHLEVTSSLPEAPSGRRIRVRGGTVEHERSIGAPAGTAVSVRHLFFNTPARRKFLKSAAREFALIVDAVHRLALPHPATAFRLIHEGEEVLRYPAAREDDRAAAVLGEAVMSRCLPVVLEAAGGLTVRGWLGRPELARGSRRQQYVFVNDRPVQSRIIGGAVEQACQQIVPAGRFPVYALFLDLSPQRVDVNVHPRKLEVRFDDDHQVFTAVARAARETLRAAQLIRSVEPAAGTVTGLPVALDFAGDAVSAAQVREAEVPAEGRLPALRLLGQLHRTYLLAQGDSGLVVIDQHAAHERILYDRLLGARRRGTASQILITPQAVVLGPGEEALLRANRETIEQVGFALEPFGDRTVLIRAVPQVARADSAERLLKDLLAEATEGRRLTAAQTLLERLTITTACRMAIRAGDALTAEQMLALLRDLAATEDPFTCFHGRPTMVTLPLDQVERWFLRR